MKNLFKLSLVVLTIWGVSYTNRAFGQFLTNTTHNLYNYNRFIFSPAHTGETGEAFLNYRNQWLGIPGNPIAYTFGIHSPFGNTKKHGVGIRLQNETRGVIERTEGSFNYSYKVDFNEINSLSFGLNAGFTDLRLDRGAIEAAEGGISEIYEQSDSKDFGLKLAAGFAAKYDWNQKLQLGVALPTLFEDGESKFKKNFIGFASYKLDAIPEKLVVEPMVMYRNFSYNKSYGQVDLGFHALWNNTLWAGFNWRSNESFIFSAGANLNNFGLGYAYQVGYNSDLANFGGTHEVQISYYFDRNKKSGQEELLNKNQMDMLSDSTVAASDDDYSKQIDSLRKEIETLKLLIQVKDLKEWSDGFMKKIRENEEAILNNKELRGDLIIFFPVNVDLVAASYDEQITKFVASLKGSKVEVVGYADERGSAEFNKGLSQRRANKVAEYLISKGVSSENIIMIDGQGETAQFGPWDKNRRTEVRPMK